MPAGASSTRDARPGRDAEQPRARQEALGVGLAVRHLVAAHHRGRNRQADGAQAPLRERPVPRRDDAPAAGGQAGQRAARARRARPRGPRCRPPRPHRARPPRPPRRHPARRRGSCRRCARRAGPRARTGSRARGAAHSAPHCRSTTARESTSVPSRSKSSGGVIRASGRRRARRRTTASSTSPRSSPSACSGSGRLHSHAHVVHVVQVGEQLVRAVRLAARDEQLRRVARQVAPPHVAGHDHVEPALERRERRELERERARRSSRDARWPRRRSRRARRPSPSDRPRAAARGSRRAAACA